MTTPERCRLSICVASTRTDAVAAAMGAVVDERLPLPSPAVIAAANRLTARREGLAQATSAFAPTDHPIRVVVTPDVSAMIRRRVARRPGREVTVHLGSRGERMQSVRLSAEIGNAATLIAANDLRGETGTRPTIAIGLWSRFAGWRERLGARLSPPEEGLQAEIALAVRPTLVVLADDWQGLSLVVATTDQVAAELAGLALKQVTGVDGDEQVGPWQDPLVQRATELDLGVRVPDQIAIRAVARGIDAEKIGGAFAKLVSDVSGRLGVRDFTVDGAVTTSECGG